MSDDWDTDAFGGSDPFGVSGDVFGRDLGDVDPFDGNDSFDGDAEWDEFNHDDENDHSDRRNGNGRSSSRNSSSRHPESPKKRGKKPSRTSSGGSPTKAEGGSRSGRSSSRSDGRGRESSSTRGPAGERSKSRVRGSRSRSVGPGDNESSSTGGMRRRTKAEHRKRQEENNPKPASSEIDTAFDATFDAAFGSDPFASNVPQIANDDGFGADFVAFPTDTIRPSQAATPTSNDGFGAFDDNNDGFGAFADFGEAAAPPVPSPTGRQSRSSRVRGRPPSGGTRHASMEESGFGQQPSSVRRSNSAGDENENVLGSHSSRSSRSITQNRHSRFRNGGSTRLRPSEQQSRLYESNSRRSAIKDSLFGALGEDEVDDGGGGISLANFLGEVDKKKGPSRTVAGDSASIHSAPAAIRPRGDRSSRRSVGGRDDRSVGSGGALRSSTGSSSRRHQRRPTRGSSSSVATSPSRKPDQTVKLDIAELAKQGYLEVQDGKMRLVIDVDDTN